MIIGIFGYDFPHYKTNAIVKDAFINGFSIGAVLLAPKINYMDNGNIINIHPSLLPKYKGLNTHGQVILNKDPYHGCSTHYVTSNIDCGPVIAQYTIPVVKNEDAEELAKKVLSVEHILFFKTLKMLENNYIKLVKNKIFYKDSVLIEPIKFN